MNGGIPDELLIGLISSGIGAVLGSALSLAILPPKSFRLGALQLMVGILLGIFLVDIPMDRFGWEGERRRAMAAFIIGASGYALLKNPDTTIDYIKRRIGIIK